MRRLGDDPKADYIDPYEWGMLDPENFALDGASGQAYKHPKPTRSARKGRRPS